MSDLLRVAVVHEDPWIFELHGELDLCSAAQLRIVCDVCGPSGAAATADLHAITFVDAAGLRALINVQDRCLATGIELRLVNPSRALTRVANLVGADDLWAA
jgi:anti-anti-sigma factor